MVDIMLDAGHGGSPPSGDPGAVGPTGLREADVALDITAQVGDILQRHGVTVAMTRTANNAVELTTRPTLANNAGARFFVSIHINSASNAAATGTETYAYSAGSAGAQLATKVQRNLVAAIGLADRGVKYNQGFVVLKNTNMPAILVEVAFINNPTEEALMKRDDFKTKAATGIAKGILEHLGIAYSSYTQPVEQPVQQPAQTGTPIIGNSVLAPNSLAGFLLSKEPNPRLNCTPYELAELFIREGAIEGVRGDIAFCQAIHETGWFRFGGDVQPGQNNYGGIGAVGGGAAGNWFESPQMGVRGMIHHLVAYATTRQPYNPVMSPRFHLVARGVAPTFEQLGGRWAVPGYDRARFGDFDTAFVAGATYGQKIVSLFNDAFAFSNAAPVPETLAHWATPYRNYLISVGMEISDERYDEPLTRGEAFALLTRLAQLVSTKAL